MKPLITVFALEDTSVQLTWPALPGPRVLIELAERSIEVAASPPAVLHTARRAPRPLAVEGGVGGPGAVTVGGLEPSTDYRVVASGPGVPRQVVAQFTTLPSPPGAPRVRLATLTDIHIGEKTFGVFGNIREPPPGTDNLEPHPLRAARAALAEAVAWGAEAIIVKGDLTRSSRRAEFETVGRLLASSPVPVLAVLGNHDVGHRSRGLESLVHYGVSVATHAVAHDLPGLRVVLGHSPSPTTKWGIVGAQQRARVSELAGGAPQGALVVFHHQPHGTLRSRCYPPGIGRRSAVALLDALVQANPATLVSSGHTHRHRLRRHGPLVITETGSPKDYPGTWTGYAVSDGGIRQVVRRIAAPEVISWTEVTGRAMGGLWQWWSPGTLAERCFTHRWPAPED